MRKYIPFGLLIIMSSLLFAVPASPEPGIIRYPDGRELTVFLRGDENRSWHETEDGYYLVKNAIGNFEYAMLSDKGKLNASGVLAHTPHQRNADEQAILSSLPKDIIFPAKMPGIETTRLTAPAASTPTVPFDQTDFPTIGSQKFLLILVEFSDVSFTHRPADFDSLMNGNDYTYNSAIGSVCEYYRATSFDRFDPHFDVVGPVVLDNGYAYYGNNDNSRYQEFVFEAITKADPLVDYALYDNDDDGTVDNIYLIYAGYGECFYGADPNTIWPHRSAYYSSNPVYDGKKFWDYSTSMEFYGTSGTTRTSVGVVCHEFGHVCGLPDFYDTDYYGSGGMVEGLGAWDAMAGGSWNDAGKRPPIFNAWSRMYLRWAEPQELISTENVTLNPVHSHNEARYFFSETENEFFMMENRQRSDWDAALPGHGLLIYHIDMNSSRWNNNTLNCNPYRQAFDLEEADGLGNPPTYTSPNRPSHANSGDPFPGTSGNNNFLDTGSPNALDWAGQASRNPIRQIAELNGVITFYFGDGNVDAATNLTLEPMGYDSVRISWMLNDAVDSVIILWSTDPDISYVNNLTRYEVGDIIAGGEVIYKGLDSIFYHTGLGSEITNYYAIFSFDDSSYVYSDKISGSVTTTSPPFYATDFSNGLPEGWIIFDRVGNGTWLTENPESRSFTSSTSTNGFMIMDSEHMGDVYIDAELITQSFNFGLSRSVVLRFEHKLEISSITLARLLYTINDGASWFEVGRWTENTIDPEICELDLTNQIKGFRDVKFKFNFRGTNEKYWCIDDFSIMSALDSGLVAGMHVAETNGSKPFTVHFMNTTVAQPNAIDTIIWEFGDGSDFNSDLHPTYTYTRSGTYTVSLAVQGNGTQSYCIKDNYITVINNAPIVISEQDTLDIRKNITTEFNLRSLFSDPDGDPLTFSWEGNSAQLNINARNDSIIDIQPGSDYLGVETVTFIATDNEGDTVSHRMDIWVSETAINNMLPQEFYCEQNYPNPFNPKTIISYQLPEVCDVRLDIYTASGRRLTSLVNANQSAGYYRVTWDASGLPSGLYFYRISAGNYVKAHKMILMK